MARPLDDVASVRDQHAATAGGDDLVAVERERRALAEGAGVARAAGGPEPLRRVGVISGAAAREIPAAADFGLDCLITGEPEEDSPYLSAELGVTLIAAGHHATETVGVRAVGDRLAQVFGVTATFLPVENPV
jgi:putative NIF3 family GTP cyclohydrolase 1 type 2